MSRTMLGRNGFCTNDGNLEFPSRLRRPRMLITALDIEGFVGPLSRARSWLKLQSKRKISISLKHTLVESFGNASDLRKAKLPVNLVANMFKKKQPSMPKM